MSKKSISPARVLPTPDLRKIWLGALMMIMIAATLLIAGCGSGDADEPSRPGLPTVQVGGSSGGPVSTPAGTSTTSSSGGATAPTGTSTPVAQLDACNIDSLNNGRFLGTGLTVVAIIDEARCPICSSGESCTNNAGQCRCLVVSSG